jgi:predicted TIM-barrel fold metal-dependent hydrolase
VHIWAPDTPERPWVLGPERAHLPVPLDAQTVISMMDEAGVDRAILVPPSLDGDRNDLCLKAARDYPDRFAVMGRLHLDHPAAPSRLEAMKGEPGLLGVRLTFHRDNDRPLLTNGKADWFWPAAEALGLPVMVHAPARLAQIGAIAERHPGLKLIVDHMGFARETMDEEAHAGAARILALAKHPNVSIKVSALPCYSTKPYPFRSLHEPLKRIIEGFGAHRAFWGSDLSRILQHCTYRQAVTMFTEEMDFLSAHDLEWIMGRGLCETLGWKDRNAVLPDE